MILDFGSDLTGFLASTFSGAFETGLGLAATGCAFSLRTFWPGAALVTVFADLAGGGAAFLAIGLVGLAGATAFFTGGAAFLAGGAFTAFLADFLAPTDAAAFFTAAETVFPTGFAFVFEPLPTDSLINASLIDFKAIERFFRALI